MALVSTMAVRPVIVFTNFKSETKLICQRTWMSEALKMAKMSICFVNSQNFTQVINYIWLKGQATFRHSELLQLFQLVGAKRASLITEVDAGTRDAICWSWPVSVLYMKYTQHWLLPLVSLGTESEWARDSISQIWPKNKSCATTSQQVASLFNFFFAWRNFCHFYNLCLYISRCG